jgi:hypothetical protein
MAKAAEADKYDIERLTPVLENRAHTPVEMAPRDAAAMKPETTRFDSKAPRPVRVPRRIFAKFKMTA